MPGEEWRIAAKNGGDLARDRPHKLSQSQLPRQIFGEPRLRPWRRLKGPQGGAGGAEINRCSARVSRPGRVRDRRSPAGLSAGDLRSARWQARETLPQRDPQGDNFGK
jgi:hypothetical protein